MSKDRHRVRRASPRSTRLTARLSLVTGVLLAAAAIFAQPAASQSISPPTPGANPLTGKDFAGIDFPLSLQPGKIKLSALRAWAWRDGATQRLQLEGDPLVEVGGRVFQAGRAIVWIEQLLIDGRQASQLAVYFENVRDSAADASVSQAADHLLVTAIVAGDAKLTSNKLTRAHPRDDAFAQAGEARLARHLESVIAIDALAPGSGRGRASRRLEGLAEAANLPPRDQNAPIFTQEGVVSLFGPNRTFIPGPEENALVITGGVVVQHQQPETGKTVQLSARSLVAFFDPGPLSDVLQFGADQMRGVYLEGGVIATDGEYTVRAPRFYYDASHNRGVALDAVFWTYDEARGMPVYVRADVIRQEAENQWTTGRATMANSSFFEPHFSLGAQSVTLTRAPRAAGPGVANVVDARNVSLKVGDIPTLTLPRFQGEPGDPALRRVRVETEQGDTILRTRWDLIALTGVEKPRGLDAELLLDGYVNRGPAVGLDFSWSTPDARGDFFGYYIHDDGEDHLTSGADIEHSNDHRGIILGEHRWRLSDEWTLFGELAYISDETFVDAFFEEWAERRREFTNSLYARRQDERSLFGVEARAPFNDFTPNEYLLQSQGYQVEKLPELTYFRVADTPFDGLLTYYSENSLSRLKLSFTEPRADQLGFDTDKRSLAAFGILPADSLADRLRARGFTESEVLRFDTRHELSAPLAAGPLNITPFVVGRATGYDDDFEDFRAPGANDDKVRLFGAAGLSLSTAITRVDDSVRSRLFDLDRIRHIVEPYFTYWASTTNIEAHELPTYDDRVENLASGTLVRLGARNTWQTKRAGVNGERSVDWIVLDTAYANWSSDADAQSPIGRQFASRPELSDPGEFLSADATMRLTNAVSLASNVIYDLDDSNLTVASGGALFDHGFGFSSYAEARRIEPLDSTFVNFGAAYELTKKYALSGYLVWDAERRGFQFAGLTVSRRFEQWTVDVGVNLNEIENDVSLSVSLRPAGIAADDRSHIFTRPLTGLHEQRNPLGPVHRVR